MREIKFELKAVEGKHKRLGKKGGKTGDMWIVFDTSKQGLETLMKDHQAMTMMLLWERDEEGTTSKEAWLQVSKLLMEKDRSISRATIINFMNDMVDAGVLNYTEKPGKGGYHRIYTPAFDEEGFKLHVAKTVMSKLRDTWPEATAEAFTSLAR